MRILHVSSWFQPALGYSEYHLPIAQQRLGHQVAVLTSDRYYPFPDYESTVGGLLGNRIVGSGFRREMEMAVYRRPVAFELRHHLWLRGFGKTVSSFCPDVIHVHEAFTFPALESALAKRKSGAALTVASSMEPEVFYPQSRARAAYYRIHKATIAPFMRRRVDVFTAVGAGARGVLASQMGVGEERVAVVPLGADAETFKPDAASRTELRRRLNIDDRTVMIVYAGKLIPDKDVHVLARAFAPLPATAGLLLVGNGPDSYVGDLRKILAGCRGPVVFVGAVKNRDLPAYFNCADIGVWPSQSSNAAVEAALCGLPLVVSETPATRHYISGGNGISFPRGDSAALAAGLSMLVERGDTRLVMGARGRDHVAASMSWEAIARRYLGMYEEAVARV
jgi:glycosyltransferase involved in cell wall biosynthesis